MLDRLLAAGLSLQRIEQHLEVCVATWPGSAPMVSDVVPLFEQSGLRLAGIQPLGKPAGAVTAGPVTLTLQSFRTRRPDWDADCARLVEQAFPAASAPGLVGDPFTRLVVGARLPLRDVQLLRAAAGYLRQVGLGHSPSYVANIRQTTGPALART